MKRQVVALLILASIGLADSVYLWMSPLSDIPLACPTAGPVDCDAVTHSIHYSHPFGISVTLMGLLWFAAMFGLGA